MSSLGTSSKRFWRWFITPPSSANLWRRTAWSLWILPPMMLFPLLLPILEPSSIPGILVDHWAVYLLFFGVPFALGAYCWRHASRVSGNAR